MELDSLYQEIILDHYKKPHGRGLRGPFEAEVHHVNPTCGDEITLRVHLGSGDVVEDVSYESHGCSISQASASVLFDQVVGQALTDALATEAAFVELLQSRGESVGDEDVLGDAVAFAGVSKYPARVKCALLSWMAFKDAATRAVAAKGTSA